MSKTISRKIYSIFNRVKNTKYNGTIRCQHFAVAIRGGNMISPVKCNNFRSYVFGKTRGSIHAEMNSLNYVLNIDPSTRIKHYTNPNKVFTQKTSHPKGMQVGKN